jgi:hypothetical protein
VAIESPGLKASFVASFPGAKAPGFHRESDFRPTHPTFRVLGCEAAALAYGLDLGHPR